MREKGGTYIGREELACWPVNKRITKSINRIDR